jgi:DNA processing protein
VRGELAAAVAAAAPPGERRRASALDESRLQARLAELGLRFLPRSDPGFPALLRAIHDPPAGLFLRGAGGAELLARPAVAVVGARSCSGYGSEVARRVGRELAAAGVVVVSGLARGIDARAHEGALEGGGATVAVLGCGVDRDYPAANRGLAARIAAGGLVVSEYPPGVEPAPWRFPARNRIVAGLCAATVVVEARERSGALITADFAMEEGREVFAVPGEITSALSDGTNGLLRVGAAPLCAVVDVLDALGVEAAARTAAGDPLLELLPASADELSRVSGREPAALAARLAELELEGAVTVADGIYRRCD